MHTSYFAQAKNLRKNSNLVSISRITPEWFNDIVNCKTTTDLSLAPSLELLNTYKNNKLSEDEFSKIYKNETLSKLDPKVIFEKYKDSVFLCYEKSDDFCHRQLVSSWLQEAGFECTEINTNIKSVAVIGSRGYSNYNEFSEVLRSFLSNYGNVRIVSGGALSGADKLVKRFCAEEGYALTEHFPDWARFGRSRAGFIRNQEIWKDADIGIAFWDGKSPGTAHSFKISKNMNKEFTVFNLESKKLEVFKNKSTKQPTLF